MNTKTLFRPLLVMAMFFAIMCVSCSTDPTPDTPATPLPPEIVVNLKITTTNGVTLAWDAFANATSYNIYTAVDNKILKIGTSTTNSYTDTFPYAGINSYRIVAVVNNVEIAMSEAAQTTVPNQLYTVPSESFLTFLKGIFPTAFTTDNKLITNSTVVRLFNGRMDLNNSGGAKTLEGIEFFTALTELKCPGNSLTTLDVSKNTELTALWCGSNNITSLDFSKNTKLTRLYCNSNKLTSIDLTQNTALTRFECNSNKLTTLDVSKNTALTGLQCSNNQLTTLDVSKNTALTSLDCSNNQLTTLDVSKNTALTGLQCSNNQLTTLDIGSQKSWNYLYSINTPYLVTLKVNASQKQHASIKEAKTNRGAAITISTYTTSSAEAPVCGNYNPNTDTCP